MPLEDDADAADACSGGGASGKQMVLVSNHLPLRASRDEATGALRCAAPRSCAHGATGEPHENYLGGAPATQAARLGRGWGGGEREGA